ncbi:MAG: response regulator [Verrucomicrobia bacterium]|nr:response regulator [Verrucomicrobiota bacterium]
MAAVPRFSDRKLTFLVVDDEPFILEYVRQVLSRLGQRVLTARNGDEAWSLFERQRNTIDFLLTDIMMPDSIDGFTLAERVRQVKPSLPILFITGALPDDDPRTLDLVERRLLLKKPFFPEQLITLLQSHLSPAGSAV